MFHKTVFNQQKQKTCKVIFIFMPYFMDYYVILVKYLYTDQLRAKINIVSKKVGKFNITYVLHIHKLFFFRMFNV